MDQDTFAVRLIQMIKMKTLTKYRPLIFKLDIVLALLIVVCISVKSPPAKVAALEITKTTYNSAALNSFHKASSALLSASRYSFALLWRRRMVAGQS